MKKAPIWERKTNTTKVKTISFKVTAKEQEQIIKAAHRAGMSQSDYIRTACLEERIVVIPEGREILTTMQEIRNLIRPLNAIPTTEAIEWQLSQITTKLHSYLTRH